MPRSGGFAALPLGLAFLASVVASAGAQPSAERGKTQSTVQRGKVLAQGMCAECHAILPAQLQSPNPYAPAFDTIANLRGMSSPALWSMLYSSHRRMPNIILHPDETRAIVSYILTMQDTE
jgi:mono/diheme cytochrome c family protein